MTVTISRPDDFHIHLRDGPALKDLVPPVAKRFSRALIMPNLHPPITKVAQAEAYRSRILATVPEHSCFNPLMTLYLTESMAPEEISRAKQCGFIHAAKLYPAGSTTQSGHGIRNVKAIYPILERMSEVDLVLAVHGEQPDPSLDPYERESRFIEEVLTNLVVLFPKLRIVLEHVSTKAGVQFVESCNSNVAATITAHHLLCSRRDLFFGGLTPHLFCRPLLQTELDRSYLLEAATGDNPKFFLGTDSAPHPIASKEAAKSAAGVYTGFAALELYAEAFQQVNRLDKLEAFASQRGADFYGLARNTSKVTLKRKKWTVPSRYPFGEDYVVPMRAGESLQFQLSE